MGLDLKNLKTSIISKIRRKIGEFFLPPEQQRLIRKLFAPSEQDQLDAASALGKMPDVQLLSLLQYYLQDGFLDELLASLPGREFRLDLAEKKTIKFYSRMAASIMLSDLNFFSYVMQMISSPAVEAEERCDLICVMGSVFETFGPDAQVRGAGITEKSCESFVKSVSGVMACREEQEEVKAACAIALKKTMGNPNISIQLDPGLAKGAFEQLASYNGLPSASA